jgi:hypothetical protein
MQKIKYLTILLLLNAFLVSAGGALAISYLSLVTRGRMITR